MGQEWGMGILSGNHSHSLLLICFTCWGEIRESKTSVLPRPQPGSSDLRRAVDNQEAQSIGFSEQRKMIGEEGEVEHARMCIYWGNTSISIACSDNALWRRKLLSQDVKGVRS